MKSSFELRNIRKLLPIFFLLEIHIVTLKAFPTWKLRSKYTTRPLKYTMHGHFVGLFMCLLRCCYSLLSMKRKLSDYLQIKILFIDFTGSLKETCV